MAFAFHIGIPLMGKDCAANVDESPYARHRVRSVHLLTCVTSM